MTHVFQKAASLSTYTRKFDTNKNAITRYPAPSKIKSDVFNAKFSTFSHAANARNYLELMCVTNRAELELKCQLTFEQSVDKLTDIVKVAAENGVTSVQYRELDELEYKQKLLIAWRLLAILTHLNVPLIINDNAVLYYDLFCSSQNPNVSSALCFNGLHLGQGDLKPHIARSIVGPHTKIGLTVLNRTDALMANFSNIDYIGAQIYPSLKSKPLHVAGSLFDLTSLTGLNSLSKLPVIAIGGINLNNAGEIIATGVKGIAVVSAIQNNPENAKSFRKIITDQKLILANKQR